MMTRELILPDPDSRLVLGIAGCMRLIGLGVIPAFVLLDRDDQAQRVSRWDRVFAALAAAFGLPYCTHGGGLVNLNILCALPNALYLETGPFNEQWREHFVDGCVLAPDGPGFSW